MAAARSQRRPKFQNDPKSLPRNKPDVRRRPADDPTAILSLRIPQYESRSTNVAVRMSQYECRSTDSAVRIHNTDAVRMELLWMNSRWEFCREDSQPALVWFRDCGAIQSDKEL